MSHETRQRFLERVLAAKGWDKAETLSGFQLRASENGSVLVNLKTSRAQLIYDDESPLHDLADLGVVGDALKAPTK